MSKWLKLLTRIRNLDKDLRFEELEKVLIAYGYEMDQSGTGSSHYVFRKAGRNIIVVPKHDPIKLAYVKIVKKAIELEEKNEKGS